MDPPNVHFEILAGPQLVARLRGRVDGRHHQRRLHPGRRRGAFQLHRADATAAATDGADTDIYTDPAGLLRCADSHQLDGGRWQRLHPAQQPRRSDPRLPAGAARPRDQACRGRRLGAGRSHLRSGCGRGEQKNRTRTWSRSSPTPHDTPDDSVALANGQLLDGQVYVRLIGNV
ncbi:MAG: hypothetical protein R2873_35675 [Caldilineaceae bacterium]